MSVIRPPRRFAGLLVVGMTIMFGALGCSSSNRSDSASNTGAPQKDARAGQPQQAQGDAAQAQGGAGQAQSGGTGEKPALPARLLADSRSLIFTGTVSVRVANVDRAAVDATSLATAAGGFVGGDDRSSDKDNAQARLTLRVPSARFSTVVSGISNLGKEEKRQLSTEDVTDQVTDVDARIATGQAGVDRVRDLLAKAQNIGEIVSLETELSRREADLESLKSRKNKLDDLTTLSTITAVLLGPQAATVGVQKHSTGFLAGLKTGWHSFTASMAVLLTLLGALLPWLAVLAVPAGLAAWWLRRARRPHPGPPAPDPS
jgi:hypothetical protein